MTGHAPIAELPAGLDWVNADQPPALSAFRGRVTLLYFWTFDGINSLNLLAELPPLERRFHDGLAVIGVHCPNYPRQCEPGIVLKAVNRLGLRHPVANDPGYLAWQQFGIEAWPSVVLLDVEGRPAGLYAGEGRSSEIAARIAALLDEAASRDLRIFDSQTDVVRPEEHRPLAFPTRVIATSQHLYVADTGHHRILEATHGGRILRQFGLGSASFADGHDVEAGFSYPQGLALHRDTLYVADTGNHAIRRVRLASGEVDTIAGTGHMGRDRAIEHPDPRAVGLAWPLDVSLDDEHLFFSLAGQNQIWALDLARNTLGVFAGSGKFGMEDGEAAYASFAHPAGLCVLGRQLIVADAGANAIRAVSLGDGRVSTVAGAGPFEFGDAAGIGHDARLQHPLVVSPDPRGLVFLVDTLNNRIKALNTRTREVRGFNLAWPFAEPEGIALAAGALWVANTNAHEIVRVDLASGACQHVPLGE